MGKVWQTGGMSKDVRIHATLPPELVAYLDVYQRKQGLKSRSAALAAAVRVLQEHELEEAYQELGKAQRLGLESYPPANTDSL